MARASAAAALLGLCLAACWLGPVAGARQLSATAVPSAAAPVASDEYFITIDNGEFAAGCQRLLLAGWNSWEMVEAAAGAPSLSGASIPVNMTGPELVRDLLAKGKAAGFNVMRTWAHAVNPQYAVQTAPGKYNEAALRGLDYLIDEARKAGIRLILAFTSNWTPTGGIPEYLKWGNTDQQVDFYTRPDIKAMYQGFVQTIVNRVNTINGRTYKEDPTIMAWNLLNEPRCNGCPNGTIAAWYDEMARFTKKVDANHLVTTGEEGFYACCGNPANPGQPYTEWAAEEGQDFIKDHASPAIDFATIHAWVDNWQQVDPQWLINWITAHAQDAATVLKKPLVLEEFGKWVTVNATIGGKFVAATLEERNSFLNVAYQAIDKLLADPASALKGSLFWQWYNRGQIAPASEGGGRGLFGIYETDDAFAPILQNAKEVAQLNAEPLAGCVVESHRAAPVDPAPDCQQTWVGGQPGTGMEGPNCNIPINECVRGTAQCDPHATCIDTDAGYTCQCWWGYTGDGKTCAADPAALQALTSLYWSEPEGLACDAGDDVAWPTSAPGYVYDPLGSFAFFRTDGAGAYGSRSNVTLQECMVACQQAPDCESFVISEVLQQCFLKKAQCPEYDTCWAPEVLCNSTDDRGGSFSFPCGHWASYYRLDMDLDRACSNITYTGTDLAAHAKPEVLQAFRDFEAQYVAKYGTQMTRITPGTEPVAAAAPGATAATAPGATAMPGVEQEAAALPQPAAAQPAAGGAPAAALPAPGQGSVALLEDAAPPVSASSRP